MSVSAKKILLWMCVLGLAAACGGHERQNRQETATATPVDSGDIVLAFVPGTDNDNAYRQGIQAALADANGKGLIIGGKPVRFVLQTTTQKQAQHLGDSAIRQHWRALLGQITVADAADLRASQIPALVLSGWPDTLNAPQNQDAAQVFHLLPTTVQQGGLIARYLLQQNDVQRVAIVSSGQHPLLMSTLHAQLQQGGKATTVYVLDKLQASQLQQLLVQLRANRPDVVFYSGDSKSAARLVRRLQQGKLLVPVMLTAEAQHGHFIQQAGEYAPGSMTVVPGLPLAQMSGRDAFVQTFRQQFSHDPVAAAAYGYDAAWVVISAMKLADSTQPSSYLPKLQSLNMASGLLSGPLTFDNRGWRNEVSMSVYQVEDGAWKLADIMRSNPNRSVSAP